MKDIYFFNEGNMNMKDILGQKGANLSEMYNIGLRVPYGFILPIHICKQKSDLRDVVINALSKIQSDNLFLSVRSSPAMSMPGMMDSYLNITSCEELFECIEEVKNSWFSRRAQLYRQKHEISHEYNSAIIIQEMVFGNRNDNSASGVIFSRNPNSGEDILFGECLFNAQGEDIVLGKKTPNDIRLLEEKLPIIYAELKEVAKKLETHFKEIQEIEFVVEDKKLFILQTRDVKKKQKRIKYEIANRTCELLIKGIASSYGAATGKVVFDSSKAKELKEQGEQIILVRPETTPEDIEGIIACDGIVTLEGGATSHAAVVARSMNKPCVCGCEKLDVNEFEWITIDGKTGEIFLGKEKLQIKTQ